jgi:uncharacterized repeat protein (TIGR01451 family)
MDFCGSSYAFGIEQRAAAMTRVLITVSAAVVLLIMCSVPLWAQSPGYSDFSSGANLTHNGNAVVPFNDGSVNLLRLNPAATGQKGSAWFTVPQPVAGGFTTTFTFRISNANPAVGNFPADGIAFVIQNSAAGTAALGQAGGAIGYGSTVPFNVETPGIENSLAIEFDTFANAWDPEVVNETLFANHVAVQSCGLFPNTADHTAFQNDNQTQIPCKLGIASSPIPLADGEPHTAEIEYTPASSCGVECFTPATLQVKLDGIPVFESPIQVDLTSLLGLANPSDTTGDSAYVGFTAATGDFVENDDILSWSFTPHTSTSITQNISPGVTTPFVFGAYNYKITPDTATNSHTDSLTVTAIPVDPHDFNPGNFSGAQCIPYGGNNGKCAEFQVVCTGADCNSGTYQLALNFDNPAGVTTNLSPGLLDAPDQSCPPPADHPFSTNIFTDYIQTRQDPVVKGSGGPRYSCFVAIQNVTYGKADLVVLDLASSKVKVGNNLTNTIPLTNLGPATANRVIVTDQLDPNTSFVSGTVAQTTCTFLLHGLTCTKPVPVACSASGQVVTCPVGVLAPTTWQSVTGAAAQVVVSVNPSACTAYSCASLTNKATVSAVNPDPKPKSNLSTVVTQGTK